METSGSQCSDSLAMIFHSDQVIYLILSLLCSLGSLRCQKESSNQLLQHIKREQHPVLCHWGEKTLLPFKTHILQVEENKFFQKIKLTEDLDPFAMNVIPKLTSCFFHMWL